MENININIKAIKYNHLSLNLYKLRGDERIVDKTTYITSVGTVYGTFKEATDILSPSIVIERGEVDFNYVYVKDLNRYYFVESFISERMNLWRLNLRVDVLMSYKNEIRSTQQFILRSQSNYNRMLLDDKISITQSRKYTFTQLTTDFFIKQFDRAIPCFVLTTINTGVLPLPRTSDTDITTPQTRAVLTETPFNRQYCITESNVEDITSNLMNSSFIDSLGKLFVNPSDWIVSLKMFPFSFKKYFPFYSESFMTDIMIADKKLTDSRGTVIQAVVHGFNGQVVKELTTFKVDKYFNNFLDYNRNISLYLPFVPQMVTLDPRKYIDRTCKLSISVDLTSGKATYFITDNTSGQMLDSVSCNMAVDIALGGNNLNENTRSLLKSVIGVGAGGAVSLLTGNPLPVLASGFSVINNISSLSYKPTQINGAGDGLLGYASPLEPFILSDDPVVENSLDDTITYYGAPLEKRRYLNSVWGYTVCNNVRFSSENATEQEQSLIRSLLEKGVIL